MIKSTTFKLTFVAFIAIAISAFTLIEKPDESKLDEKAAMIADWQWAKDYTLAYIESMPAESINFRPEDSIRSFSEQMLHLTSANVSFTYAVTELTHSIDDVRNIEYMDKYKNKAALTEIVTVGYDYVIESIEATSTEKLNNEVMLFGQFRMTGVEALHKAFIHQNHHRGQTAVYIRLAGAVPAPMQLF